MKSVFHYFLDHWLKLSTKKPFDLEKDFVEVGPPQCPHKGEKRVLMFGEVICVDCNEWTGKIED